MGLDDTTICVVELFVDQDCWSYLSLSQLCMRATALTSQPHRCTLGLLRLPVSLTACAPDNDVPVKDVSHTRT